MASYPSNDTLFSTWLANFISVANNNLTTLSMTAADITLLQTQRADLDAKVASFNAAQAAAKSATSAKAQSRRTVNATTNGRANMILANPNIPNSLKEQLGLNPRSKPTATAPAKPLNLVASPLATGVNVLTWEEGGNRVTTTQYFIEAKYSQNGAWRLIDAVTKTRYEHKAQTPGVRVGYRVRAKRGDVFSDYSTDAVAYMDAAFPLEDNGVTL